MDAEIDATVFGNMLRSFSLKEMIIKLNEYVKTGTTVIKNGSPIEVRPTVAYSILSLYPNTSDIAILNNRKSIYDFCSAYRNMSEYSLVDTTETDLWKESDNYWFSNSYTGISSKNTIANVASSFFKSAKTQEDTLSWLDKYIQFYCNHSHGDLIKEQAVFPNQQLNLKKLSELRYDNNIPEEFKDLADIAYNPLSPVDVYRHQLLHRTIKGYEQHNPLAIKDIYEYVKKRFAESNDSTKEAIARHTITILVKPESGEPEEKKLYDFATTISGYAFNTAKYVDTHSGFHWGFAQEYYIKLLANRIATSVNLDGFKKLSPSFTDNDNIQLTHWIDSFIEFLHNYKSKKYWAIITDKETGIGVWLNQNNCFCRFHEIRKDDNISEDLKDICASNKHVMHDYRDEMFTLNSSLVSYLETKSITLSEIGEFVDDKIKNYEGNKQDNDFRSLVFTIGKLCNQINGLEAIMSYFKETKNSLIVWSLGEGTTMDLVGSIVQQGDEKLRAIKELLESNNLADLSLLVENSGEIKNLTTRIQELEDEKEDLLEKIRALKEDRSLDFDFDDYSGLSKAKQYEAQVEAQRKLMELFPTWYFPSHYGELDETGKPYCQTTEMVANESGEFLPIVLKSYKSRGEVFNVNIKEWKWVVDENARLLVYTYVDDEPDIVEIPREDLIMKQSHITLTFNSENLDAERYKDRISDFANTLQYFSGLHFRFDHFHIKQNAPRAKDIYAIHVGTQTEQEF